MPPFIKGNQPIGDLEMAKGLILEGQVLEAFKAVCDIACKNIHIGGENARGVINFLEVSMKEVQEVLAVAEPIVEELNK